MIKLSFFLLFLFSLQIVSAADLIEGKESQDFQDSAFIKLMTKLNNGEIPYPFTNLLDSFKLDVKEGTNILFIPKGRSLVKEYADYKNPRIIVRPLGLSIDSKEIAERRKEITSLGINENDLFIGFAPNHKALEVISYNPKKGGYDFFIIENYEKGKIPKIVNNPGLCLTCHQNEGPLFSRFPWNESLGDSAISAVLEKGNVEDKSNQIMDLIRKANSDRASIEGIPLKNKNLERFSSNAVSGFDQSVRTANDSVLATKACEALCAKGDIECIKSVFKMDYVLSSKGIDQRIDSMDMKSSAIPNRDPFKNIGYKALIEEKSKPAIGLDYLYGPMPVYDVTFNESGFQGLGMKEIANPVTDPDFFNPATPRPTSSSMLLLKNQLKKLSSPEEKFASLFTKCLPPDFMETLASGSLSEILNKDSIKKAYAYWPSIKPLTAAILKELKNLTKAEIGEKDCSDKIMKTLVVFKANNLEEIVSKVNEKFLKKPEALFRNYCMECHGGIAPFIPLPLNSLEDMANYKPNFSNKGVLERLEKNIMPPSFADKQPTAEEREEMIKVIKELKK
jgi:hypothetical protein